MIFIYPCITSENVNRQIVPAATKTMEQFFLLQLQNAFNDGVIGCVSAWDGSKHRYGPIVTESSKFENGELLKESAFKAVDNIKMVVTESKVIYKNDYNKPRVSATDSLNEIVRESLQVETKLHTYRIKLESLIDCCKEKSMKTKYESTLKQVCEDIKTEHKFRTMLEGELGRGAKTAEDVENTEYWKQKGKQKAEDEINKDKTSKNRDAYRKAEDYKIDLTPTSMAIDVDVTYTGGSKDGDVNKRTIMIGVKVVPIQIKNFKKVNDALLDDYFSKTSENFWTGIKRAAARKLIGGVRTAMKTIGLDRFAPDPTDMSSVNKNDVVKQMITLAPSDFVNASAFRSDRRNAPMNYRFTSSVVMFNKDDLDEDVNIFANRSAMNRLFKLGWTSFAVLDPVKEVMLFISSLDGGFLHELPYSYMFNSLQANDIYKNESGLRNGTRPFSIRKGNFATFARSL